MEKPMCAEELYALYRTRQSDRKFSATPIPQEVLRRIVENALLAPSATNQQPWSLVVVSDPEMSHRVGKAVVKRMTKMNQFATEAPVHILVVAERGNWLASIGKSVVKLDYRPIDLGILVAHLVLAAQAEGVGSCVLGWFNEEAVRKEVGIPKSKKIALDIVLGYSEQATREKKRKDPKSILHWDKW